METAETLPLTLGIRTTYKGYYYLVTALEQALEDESRLLSYSTTIFPYIAEKYHTNIKCVERNIRTIIKICWESPSRKMLQNLAPYPLERQPSVGEFIDLLFWYLSRQEQMPEQAANYFQ